MIQNEQINSESSLPLSQTERTALVVRSLRNLFGMSQNELASAAGVSRPTISRLEKLEGGTSIRSSTLDNLMAVFAERGVEVHFAPKSVRVDLSEAALMAAANEIKSQGK